MGHFERRLDDLGRQTVDLEVHLDGGDTLVGAGDLEVHIAVEVLDALDINHGHPLFALGDKTAGDTRNGSLDRHARVHKRECGAADRRLRGGTVGGNDLGNEADGVGELLGGGKHGNERALGKCSVTYLTSAGAAGSLCLAGGVAGHIVVVHISLGILVVDAVEHLSLGEGPERCHCNDLCLTSREHTRAVHSLEESHLGGKGSYLVEGTTVNALALKQPATDDLLLHLIDQFGHLGGEIGIFLAKFFDDRVLDREHSLVTDILVVGIESVHEIRLAEGKDLIEHIVIKLAGRIFEFGLAYLIDNAVDEHEQILDLGMSLHDSVVHNIVGNFVGARLDHDHLVHRRGNGQLKVALFSLCLCGIDDELAVNKTHENARDRSVPRNIRYRQCDGGAEHSGDLWRAVLIDRHNGECECYVVAQILGEEGTDRAVDDARGQYCLFAGFALALEVTAGDLSRCVHSLLIVNRQGEEVYAVAGLCGRGGAAKHGGIAVADEA